MDEDVLRELLRDGYRIQKHVYKSLTLTDDDDGDDYDYYNRLILLQNLRPYSLGTGNSSHEKQGKKGRTFFYETNEG